MENNGNLDKGISINTFLTQKVWKLDSNGSVWTTYNKNNCQDKLTSAYKSNILLLLLFMQLHFHIQPDALHPQIDFGIKLMNVTSPRPDRKSVVLM